MNRLDIKITLRSIYRDKLYTLSNLAGLAIAFTSALALGLYAYSEFSVDQHHANKDRIVRLVGEYALRGDSRGPTAISSRALGPLFTRAYPELGEFVRLQTTQRSLIQAGDTQAYRADLMVTDPNVFRVFSHDIIYGDPKTALRRPDTVAINQSLARFYFGDSRPLGQTLVINDVPYQVSLVFADIGAGAGADSHLRYSALVSMGSALNRTGIDVENTNPEQLFGLGVYTYLLLKPGIDKQQLQSGLNRFYQEVMEPVGKQRSFDARLWAQDLSDIYFDNGLSQEIPGATGNKNYVIGLASIAVLLIAVACINYANQATALAARQATSIGVRRLLGAGRWRIAGQNLLEAQLLVFMALLIALALGELLQQIDFPLPPLNLALSEQLLATPALAAWVMVLTILTGLAAGAYPALYLSRRRLSANPGNNTGQSRPLGLRHLLVALQFVITIAVLNSTVVVNRQMQFLADRPLGFDSNNLLSINLRGADSISRLPQIKNQLLAHPGITGISESGFIPGGNVSTNSFRVERETGSSESALLNWTFVGLEFTEVMDIALISGDLLRPSSANEQPVLVNQSLVQQMGWHEPLGKTLRYDDVINGRVVGVMEDFHFESLRAPIGPLFVLPYFEPDFDDLSTEQRAGLIRPLLIRIDGKDPLATLQHIESTLSQYNPGQPFEYWFFDENLNSQYWRERQLLKLITVFSSVCVIIALIGLVGLTAFTAEQSTKEIGIRKVLGATLRQVLQLLLSRTLTLIIVAGLFASVISYLLTRDWLAGFTFRLPLTWHYFLLGILVVVGVSLAVMAGQSLRIANRNPVEALRDD